MAILRKLPAAVAVAALTVTLYGCGGGGGNRIGDLEAELASAKAAQEAAEQARDEAMAAQAAAEAAQATAEAAQAAAEAAQATAEAMQAAAEAARDEANAARMAADENAAEKEAEAQAAENRATAAAEAQANAEAAQKAAEDALAEANDKVAQLEADLKTAEDQLAAIEEEKRRLEEEAAAAKASATAKAILDSLISSTRPTATATFEASSDGVFTAKSTGLTASDAPAAISGWRGATLTKTGETLVVYTDIEDATATKISDTYDNEAGAGQPVNYKVVNDGDADNQDIDWSNAKRADGNSSRTTDGTDITVTFLGSVRGVDGTFSCTGERACDLPAAAADGALSSNADWRFTPNDPNATYDVQDDDGYVWFGWLQRQTNAAGQAEAYQFAPVRGSTVDANTGTGAALKGTATYTGGAAGKYAIASQTENKHSSGSFTATATLSADFDHGATDDMVAVSGEITDFETEDGTGSGWRVVLGGATASDAQATGATVASITGGTAQWSTGGAQTGTGSWAVSAYGAVKGTGDDAGQPTVANGTFDAAISADVASIRGAYGVTRQ